QVQGAPRDWLTSIGQCITNRIGIVESSVGKQIERWIWICRPFRVGRNLQSSLPDANGRIRRGGYACQRAQERGDERQRPERGTGRKRHGAAPPSESAWRWGPTRSQYRHGRDRPLHLTRRLAR